MFHSLYIQKMIVKSYQFVRTGRDWFIDLPEFIQQGGSPGDLQMIDGADKMLDLMAENKNSITLQISDEPFESADVLSLTEKCDPYVGGGYYHMKLLVRNLNLSATLKLTIPLIYG